jgi:hypothetical protein
MEKSNGKKPVNMYIKDELEGITNEQWEFIINSFKIKNNETKNNN